MPSDIFLSYSRKDSTEALDLAERLRADGMTVWIDRHGIGGAEQWATEIASAIRDCDNLLLLLSEHAIHSANVLKEVALAAEKGKRILPVILRKVPLPVALEYHLAGVHYLHYADYASIASALKGSTTETPAPVVRDDRKSLLVLPFEDLSPGQDNAWFADGLTSELITSLSKIKSLRLIDRNTSMDFKGARGHTRDIARDLSVRYFLQGAVRKFGEQIKISVELLDIETGEYLWHDAHKGVFADIFEIQESVAKKVVEGLELTLTREEQKSIEDRGTENPEAYELYLRAYDLYNLWTRQSMLEALSITGHITQLDPKFAEALRLRALALSNLYRLWDRNPKYLEEAESLYTKARKLRPGINVRYPLISLLLLQRRHSEAETIAIEGVRENPEDYYSHFSLGYFYFNSGQMEKAVPAYEDALQLNPKYKMTYWNLIEALDRLGRKGDRKRYSEQAIPHFERWLLLNPEDQFARAQFATLLLYAGEKDRALKTIEPLLASSEADGLALYTVAVMYMHLDDPAAAMLTLDRAITAGFSHLELLKTDPNFAPLADSAEFRSLIERMSKETAAV
jgi:TolB-like protein